MQINNLHPLTSYREVTPLCEKGHVVLVQNEGDGELYVKKRIRCYNPDIFLQLQKDPVKNTPAIYGIYGIEKVTDGSGTDVTVIEEYFPGVTIGDKLSEGHLFTEKETIDIGLQLCRILMDLHGRKPALIHRDIKPSNVILLPDGAVKLLDFNAAKAAASDGSRDTVLLGTAGYAAPEQYGFSSSTPQTDIYAVGVLLNTMLTGSLPWEKVADGKLEKIIRRCLKLNPKDRYAGSWELYHALKRAGVVKSPWLPPGFRTLRPWKMLVALPFYLLIALFSLGLGDPVLNTPAEISAVRIMFFLSCILPILFYFDYLGIRRWFPFMRSVNKRLRVLGLVLAPVFIALMIFVILVLLHLIFT